MFKSKLIAASAVALASSVAVSLEKMEKVVFMPPDQTLNERGYEHWLDDFCDLSYEEQNRACG